MRLMAAAMFTLLAGIGLWQSLTPSVSTDVAIETDTIALRENYLRGGTRTQFSAIGGEPINAVSIASAERMVGSDLTQLQDIEYRGDGDDGVQWHIVAAAGRLYESPNELVLENGVTIIEETQGAEMVTESMHLFMAQQRAIGDREVIVTGSGSRTRGDGFELDLAANTAILKGNVRTDYE